MASGVSWRRLGVPRAGGAGRGRGVLRRGRGRGQGHGGPGRVRGRGRQLGRPGRPPPGQVRRLGDPAGPRARPGRQHVRLPDPGARAGPERGRPPRAPRWSTGWAATAWRAWSCGAGTTGTIEEVPAAALFVMIGGEPRTEWLAGVERDDRGYILTGHDLLGPDGRPGRLAPAAAPAAAGDQHPRGVRGRRRAPPLGQAGRLGGRRGRRRRPARPPVPGPDVSDRAAWWGAARSLVELGQGCSGGSW